MSSAGDLNPKDNNAHMLYIPIAIFGVLCPALVVMRIWSRRRKGGQLGADDYTIIASLVSASSEDSVSGAYLVA